MRCKNCGGKIKKEDEMRVGLSFIHKKCLDDYVKKVVMKTQKRKQQELRKRRKKQTDLQLTQSVFNKFIRLRDTDEDGNGICISCGKPIKYESKSYHAGHYHSVGARSDLRFNEDNTHGQCQNCNCYGTTITGIKYKENLIKKIGKDRVKALDEFKRQDYSKKALKKIRKYYNQKIREYEQKRLQQNNTQDRTL